MFQSELLRRCLRDARTWADVACGTGYVLRQFPEVARAGLDYSPAMLEKAQARNPGVTFVHGNYREPRPDWNDRWDVVSCMWWAYCYAESMTDIERLVARLAVAAGSVLPAAVQSTEVRPRAGHHVVSDPGLEARAGHRRSPPERPPVRHPRAAHGRLHVDVGEDGAAVEIRGVVVSAAPAPNA